MHWSFWKFTDLGRFSKCWHMIIYVINKSHLLISASVSLEELISILKLLNSQWWIYGSESYKILIFTWEFKFYEGQQILSDVFLEVIGDRLISLIFKKISARYCLNSRICLLYVLASKKWYSKKKAANLADSSNNCTNNAFHGINWHVLVCSWSALFVPPVSLNHLYSEVKI